MERFIGALSLTFLLSSLAAVAQVAPTHDPVNLGIKSGLSFFSKDLSETNTLLSRAELASILVKTFHLDKQPPTSEIPLQDVSSTHWAYRDIQLVLSNGIMAGYRQGRFFPDQRMTRAEAFSILAQAHGIFQFSEPTVTEILAKYPDAAQIPAWARKPMATALAEGFINIRQEQRIDPLSPMTRADMSYALNQYLSRRKSPLKFPPQAHHSLNEWVKITEISLGL